MGQSKKVAILEASRMLFDKFGRSAHILHAGILNTSTGQRLEIVVEKEEDVKKIPKTFRGHTVHVRQGTPRR